MLRAKSEYRNHLLKTLKLASVSQLPVIGDEIGSLLQKCLASIFPGDFQV